MSDITAVIGQNAPINATMGMQGPAGAAASVTVGTVTTGAAGSSATVTNRGTSKDAILDFSITVGATGDVTPAATQAKNDAQTAATNVLNYVQQCLGSANSAQNSATTALNAVQSIADYNYPTYTAKMAD